MGGVAFTLCVLRGLPCGQQEAVMKPCRRLMFWSAVVLVVIQLCYVAANSAVLAGTAGIPLSEVAGANFFIAGAAGVCAAIGIGTVTMRKGWKPTTGLLALAAITGQVMTSHAVGRLEHHLALCVLTALHQAATASWSGAMPYLELGLARSSDAGAARFMCGRFSIVAL